ncbi:glycosyltransferase [Ferruginibacter lapsinanis]|uniref:glycosyltransferase family 2 protein n=1 Tax=Ferruginibacter lapsinanis TaxID=563172 RepID=UPI001E2B1611|nr:glycosyltransferase family 2 protein [Ferruginibacter lapsinanis]UEG49459.1 glycosyltransferase [Ferruginibacter lapsinanis]
MPRISIVIPVKNGQQTLGDCLKAISEQSIYPEIEIIILDSESVDGSVEIAKSFGAKIITIPNNTFDHGLTRNIGVGYAQGELIFLTVQDAVLADKVMLEKMAAHFQDANVMSVCGHQAVSHDKDKNPLLWFKRYSEPKAIVKKFSPEEFNQLSIRERVDNARWDDVVAMYRKEALIEQPFIQTEFAEDCVWAYQALSKGWKLVYDPSILVFHYHHSGYKYAYKVAFSINYHFYHFFGYLPSLPISMKPILQVPYQLIKNPALSIREKIYWLVYNYSEMLGNFFSHLYFLTIYKLKGGNGVKKSFEKICKQIPQGQQKKL